MKGINVCETCLKYRETRPHFLCPNDGLIHQEYVDFLCNTCKASEMIYHDGIYFCPECLTSTNALQCRLCGSPEVTFPKNVA